MQVDERSAAGSSIFEGVTRYFCSTGCKTKFDSNPSAYAGAPPSAAVSPGATYTCPMHPEIERSAPGS